MILRRRVCDTEERVLLRRGECVTEERRVSY